MTCIVSLFPTLLICWKGVINLGLGNCMLNSGTGLSLFPVFCWLAPPMVLRRHVHKISLTMVNFIAVCRDVPKSSFSSNIHNIPSKTPIKVFLFSKIASFQFFSFTQKHFFIGVFLVVIKKSSENLFPFT